MAFFSINKVLMFFAIGSLAAIGIQSMVQIVYAAEGGETIIRRVEIWGLFYRMMVAAFVVGAIVQGLMIYIAWRYRESNKQFKLPDKIGGKI